jgi:3-deoxy-D-manno-octulosonate 8-phosphate phosphatase (KDO 8-P phosphatase)
MKSPRRYQGNVRLVLFDVDGVLTDGSLLFNNDGEFLKSFNVRDGVAIGLLRRYGIASGILSGRSSPPLTRRATELGFDVVVTGRSDKLSAYEAIKQERGLRDEQIVYVGDDVIDLPVMLRAGLAFAPLDAHVLALRHADHVTRARGGRGVAREVAESVLLADGMTLDEIYQAFLKEEVWDAIVQ